MPQDGKIIAFNVDDLKIRKLNSDSTGGTTYGDWLDALGVQSFTIQPEFTSAELPGDGTTLDIFSKLKKLTGQFVIQISFEVLEVLLGGTSDYDGDASATYTIKGTDLPGYFEFDVQCLYRGGGDAAGGDIHFRVHKAKLTSFQYNMQFEQYATLQVDWEAVARLSDKQMGQIIENATATTIEPGAADTTPPTFSTVSPSDAATNVAINTNVTWTLSKDIRFKASQYKLYRVVSATDLQPVAAQVTYNSTTRVVTLNPDADLVNNEDYAGIAQGVSDLHGNTQDTPSVINFTTIAA